MYGLLVYATYMANGTIRKSNVVNAGYSVMQVQSRHNASSGVTLHAKGIAITYIPAYISIAMGGQSISEIGIKDTSSTQELVNISVGSNYTGFLQLSTSSLYMQPNQTAYVQLLLKSPRAQARIATYAIPIRINAITMAGTAANITERITLLAVNTSGQEPAYSQPGCAQLYELDHGHCRDTGLEQSETMQNATLSMLLPSAVASSASQISAYGLQSNVSQAGNAYRINWFVPNLPKGQVAFAY